MKKWQEYFKTNTRPKYTMSIIDDSQMQFEDDGMIVQIFNEDGVFWYVATAIDGKKIFKSELMGFDTIIKTFIRGKVFISTETSTQTKPKRKLNLIEILKNSLGL